MSQVLSEQEVRAAIKGTNHMIDNCMCGPFWPELEEACRAIEAAILAKLAGKLKDAERYAWLREQDDPEGKFAVVKDIFWRGAGDCDPSFFGSGKDLDAAIDASIDAQISLTLKESG